MSVVWFALASLCTFLVASGASVAAAGSGSGRAWGAGGLFQVLCVLSLVATVMLLVGFGIGAAIARRLPRRNLALLLGFACACIFVAMVWIGSTLDADPAQAWPMVFALVPLGAAAPFFQRRNHP